ncbi:hypothetical protein V8F33_002597 [Rhypophila sp. PSN 637]
MSRFQRQPICLHPIAPRPPETPSRDPAQPGAARKRTRASKPKVRTGCKTCKIRHLKCDEAKPACRQCSKVRMVCDGYDHHRSPSSGESTSPTPSLSPSRTKYSTHDIPYLDFFRYQLIDDFAGSSCTDFWSRVVLCEAMTSDSVRHITLAIAALSKAISESPSDIKPSPLSPWTEKSVINTTHAVALRHYVKALSLFRHQHLDNGIQSPRAVLIMTLLLITFELLQGNMESVDNLLTTSIQLLRDSLTHFLQNKKAVLSTYDQKRKEDDVSDIEHMLPFLSITGGWTPFLKTQQANLSIWETTPLAENVPPLHHYSTPMQLQTIWGRFFLRATAFTGQAFMAIDQSHHGEETLRRWKDQQETYLGQLVQWQAVIGSALTNHSLQQQETTALQVMRLHCQMLEIGVLCCLDKTDMLWDAYDSAFDVLVGDCLTLALASRKSNKAKLYGKWTMQMGILSTLGPAIAKCRNHDIRMRALEMARRMPWREGAWDAEAELFGKLGAVLLEERGRDLSTGIVSAENRWTWVDGSWDVAESKLVGRYVRSVSDEVTGQPVFQTLELGLGKLPDICREVGCAVDHAVECRALEY